MVFAEAWKFAAVVNSAVAASGVQASVVLDEGFAATFAGKVVPGHVLGRTIPLRAVGEARAVPFNCTVHLALNYGRTDSIPQRCSPL